MNNENKKMKKLITFYPFSKFLRVTQEFYEDKAIIKSKSFEFENEFEFKYEDVGEISDGFITSNEQETFGFILTSISGLILFIFVFWLTENIFWLRIVQSIFIIGLVLFTTSFIRSRYIFVFDRNGYIRTRIKQNRYKKDLISEIIKNIKKNSQNIEELDIAKPFPLNKYEFEYKYFRFTEFKRSVDRFYENEIIGVEKTINRETIYKVKYNLFNGEVFRGKISSDAWQYLGYWCGILMITIYGLKFGFNINFLIPTKYIFFTLLATVFISWLISFSKREVFGFYNKNKQIEYWAYVNKNEKEKVEKIIEYVKSRIPEENKE